MKIKKTSLKKVIEQSTNIKCRDLLLWLIGGTIKQQRTTSILLHLLAAASLGLFNFNVTLVQGGVGVLELNGMLRIGIRRLIKGRNT